MAGAPGVLVKKAKFEKTDKTFNGKSGLGSPGTPK
jgi:hypothetical protein